MLSWTFATAALLLILLLPRLPDRLRPSVLAAASFGAVALIWTVPLLPILASTVLVFGVSWALPRLGSGLRRLLLAVSIAAVLAVLIVTRLQGVAVLGLSYLALKLIQHLADAADGRAGDVDLASFVSTIFFFPSFAAGPIARTTQFARDLRHPALDVQDRLRGVERIVFGIGKKFLIADPLLAYADPFFRDPLTGSGLQLLAAVYAFTFGLYLDFAGYSDIAIGVARCAGVRLPENFDSPFLARNLSLLWQRWHMSLTGWLRDFVFLPSTRRLLRWTRRPLASQMTGQMLTMVLCGVWHGLAWNFAVWGAYNGVGVAGVAAWRHLRGPAPAGRPVRDAIATLWTFHYFAFGLVLFACDLPQAAVVLRRMVLWSQ